jgi:VanZ family protein
VPATLVASGIAVILLAGKFVFHGRYASVADIVVESVGGLLGVLLARRAVTHRVGYDRRHRVARQR